MSTQTANAHQDLSWSQIEQVAREFAIAMELDTDTLAQLEQSMTLIRSGVTLGDLKGFTDKELRALHGVAHHFYTHGAYGEAQSIYNLLIRLDHFQAKYYLGLAACKQMQKDYQGALIVYKAALFLNSSNPKIPFNSAVCYLAMDQLEAARQALAHANQLLVHPIKQTDQPLYVRVLKLHAVLKRREGRGQKNKQKEAV